MVLAGIDRSGLTYYIAVVFADVSFGALQATVADGFARVVRNSADERLERVLSTPVGRPMIAAIFWQMPRHLNRASAAELTATVRWHITLASTGGVETYELDFANGRCRSRKGETDVEPRLTITGSGAEFVKLATGNSDPVQAYLGGKVALAGDIMLAARMQALFRIPGSRQSSRTVSSSR